MKNKVRNILYIGLALFVFALIPVFLTQSNPMQVDLPKLNLQEVEAQEQAQQKAAQATAQRALARKMFQCEKDEDCIIVDKDPCGCLVGPSGVTTINVEYTLQFTQKQSNSIAAACPDGEPSQEQECSPSARAVCREQVCKIVY